MLKAMRGIPHALFVLLLTVPAASEHAIEPQRETREILGGSEIEEGEFPFVVYLETQGVGRCTGSLIASQWILTAGHCVANDDGSVVAPSGIRVEHGWPLRHPHQPRCGNDGPR